MKRDVGWVTAPPVFSSVHYSRSRMWNNGGDDTAPHRRSVISPDNLQVVVNGVFYYVSVAQTLDLDAAASWDTTAGTDYSVAANRAGVQFYLYACQPTSGVIPILLCSAASTYPAGYTATTSRKIVSFHCLCLNVGTIAGHSLTGYLTGDVLARSIQDLLHRPAPGFIPGMTWGGKTDWGTLNYSPVWKAIYIASGTGANVASAFGAAASVSRDWNAFASDFGLVGCRMMTDSEFQVLATGVEEEVNISGSVAPASVGGHVSTTSRRMISNIGSEDDAGVYWQWLSDQSYQYNPDGNQVAATQVCIVYYVSSLEGKALYLKLSGAEYVLASDIAANLLLTFGSYKVPVFADADPTTGGYQVYFRDSATLPLRLYAAVPDAANVFVRSRHPDFRLPIVYNADPASQGVEIRYDNVTHSRLEAVNTGGVNANIDLSVSSPTLSYYNLPGTVGGLYRQGVYGDVKLLCGGAWTDASDSGSRTRRSNCYRWVSASNITSRFACIPCSGVI